MSLINIKKSVVFDPQAIMQQHHKQSDSDNQPEPRNNYALSRMPKLIVTQMDYNTTSIKPPPPKPQPQQKITITPPFAISPPSSHKINVLPPQIPTPQQPQIKISWAEQQTARFQRELALMEELEKVYEDKETLNKKLTLVEGKVTRLEVEVMKEREKRKGLEDRLDQVLHEDITLEKYYKLQADHRAAQNTLRLLELQNHELKVTVQHLKPKQTQLQWLTIEHNSIKLRCQHFQQINERYRQEISNMRKNLKEFQNEFYSLNRRSGNKKEEGEVFVTMTERRVEFFQGKVQEFEDVFHGQQLATYEMFKTDTIQKFDRMLKNDLQRINFDTDTNLTPQQKQHLIQKTTQKHSLVMSEQLNSIQKKITSYKQRIHQTKLNRQSKTIRQRVAAIQSKITQLTHSQILTNQNLSARESVVMGQLKKKLQERESELDQVKKSTIGRSHLSFMSMADNDRQKYTIQVSQPDSVKGKSNNMVTVNMGGNLTMNMNVNMKVSKVDSNNINDQLERNKKVVVPTHHTPNSAKYQYQDGTPVLSLAEYALMRTQIRNLKKQLKSYEQQVSDIRNTYQKVNTSNNELYKQAQSWKKKYNDIANDFQRFKLTNKSLVTQLESDHSSSIQFLSTQLSQLTSENHKLSSLITRCQAQQLQSKKQRQALNSELQHLRKQYSLMQTRYETQLCEMNAGMMRKRRGKYDTSLEEEMQRKDGLLERQLEENLGLVGRVEELEEKVKGLEGMIEELSAIVSQKVRNEEQLNKELYTLAYRMEEANEDLRQKDLRIKKAEQNLSIQIAQKRAQLASTKKQNQKLLSKLQTLKQTHQKQLLKRDKKYKRLEEKLIGIEESNKSLKESLKLSRSLSLGRKGSEGSLVGQQEELFLETRRGRGFVGVGREGNDCVKEDCDGSG